VRNLTVSRLLPSLYSLSPSPMTSSSSPSADDYARACLRVACAQLAEAAGFASARRTALDVLSDAAARYAASLGRAAKGYAEAAGRGTGNISDVVRRENRKIEREGERERRGECVRFDRSA
jgi:histone H3/H4